MLGKNQFLKSFGYNKQRQELFGITVKLFQNEVIQFLEK